MQSFLRRTADRVQRGTLMGLAAILLSAGAASSGDLAPLLQAKTGAAPIAEAAAGEAAMAAPADGIAAFYAMRGWKPFWTGSPEAEARAALLTRTLMAAEEEGLAPADYRLAAIAALTPPRTRDAQAELELQLTHALVDYARDVGHGRLEVDPATFDIPNAMPRMFDAGTMLASAAAAPDLATFVAGLPPGTPDYARLRDGLRSLRERLAKGGWTMVPARETLRPGMSAPEVPLLRRRLIESGDLAPAAVDMGAFYDLMLEDAVRRFQRRHGLADDGVVGARTFKALDVTVTERIQQVRVNLERLRHAGSPAGSRSIVINIPDYHLTFRDEAPLSGLPTAYESRVVVGTIRDQTPTFIGEMTYLEINPNWHVPRSIAVREMLPELRKDPSYLDRNNYVLSSGGEPVDPWLVDWSMVSAGDFHYRIRQRPGVDNALGRVKFMFPNRYNVYIHDTPSKTLFARSQRSFSHGCIRLSNPFDLAVLLLGEQGWDHGRFERVVERGRTRTVSLDRPVPVHILYQTAWVAPDGSLQFRDDIYGRDADLAQRLATAGS